MVAKRFFYACAGFLCLALASLSTPRWAQTEGYVYVTQWGSEGSGDGQFSGGPSGVAIDADGYVYVADYNNHRIQKFTSTGTYLTQWGTQGSGDGQFLGPVGVATDAAGNVYATDVGNSSIQKFTSTGIYLTQWGTLGSGNGQFDYPWGVATDAAGNVYVTEYSAIVGLNHRIQKFTSTGTYLTQWGTLGSGDGQFFQPVGVAIDAAGNVYVADHNHRIQKFTSTGAYLMKWGSFGSGKGQFAYPNGVATDAAGNVFVVDQSNYRIQKFAPDVTPTNAASWGGVKARYLPEGKARPQPQDR